MSLPANVALETDNNEGETSRPKKPHSRISIAKASNANSVAIKPKTPVRVNTKICRRDDKERRPRKRLGTPWLFWGTKGEDCVDVEEDVWESARQRDTAGVKQRQDPVE